MEAIHERVWAYRRRLQLSQDYVASRLDVSRSTYTQIENGKRKLLADEAVKLSEVFCLSTDQLLGRTHFSPRTMEMARRLQDLGDADQLDVMHVIEEKERALRRMREYQAKLTSAGRYTRFTANGCTITFLHGKDLVRYHHVKEWDHGYLVVECLGKKKGQYEEYIDLRHILGMLHMDADSFLQSIESVEIEYE